MFLEISQNSQENICARVSFLTKRLWRRCFPENLAKFLRASFLQNTSGRSSNLAKLESLDTNLAKLESLDTNLTKLESLDTNVTKLESLDTNLINHQRSFHILAKHFSEILRQVNLKNNFWRPLLYHI